LVVPETGEIGVRASWDIFTQNSPNYQQWRHASNGKRRGPEAGWSNPRAMR